VPPVAQEREAAGRMGASPSPAAQAAPPLLPPLAGLFPGAEPAPGDLPGARVPLALGPAGMAGEAGEAGVGGGGGGDGGGGGGGGAWGGSGLQPILAQYRSGDALPGGAGGDGGGAPQGVARPRRMLSETLHEVRTASFRRAQPRPCARGPARQAPRRRVGLGGRRANRPAGQRAARPDLDCVEHLGRAGACGEGSRTPGGRVAAGLTMRRRPDRGAARARRW